MIPVYNHGLTVGRVIGGAQAALPVIVVDDGSTDSTRHVLAAETGLTLIRFAENQGKGAALRAGFARAAELGFTHAITIDADGQHSTDALGDFIAACRKRPDAFIIGVRDLKAARAPLPRRLSNHLSTFWFRFETGVHLGDTQCGYRCYPLGPLGALAIASGRYAFELEIMVKAAWAGIPVLAQPVEADYAAPTSRLSHFKPWSDFLRISHVHGRLAAQAFCVPAVLRQRVARGEWSRLARRHRWRTALRHLLAEHTDTPARVAGAVGLGLFCGIAPIWGFQMAAAAALAHALRLNKTLALAASNVSFPLAAPFIMAAGLVLGHWMHTGQWLRFPPGEVARQIPVYLGEWVVGSLVLAILVGAAGGLSTWLMAHQFFRSRGARRDD